jgi:cytochrome c553
MKRNVQWTLLAAALTGAVLSASTQAEEGSREAGRTKFYTCVGCHGIGGYSNSYPAYPVPRIGGQYGDYVVSALKGYRSGERKHGSMQGNAISLSDQDITDIAAYVSGFRGINVDLPADGNLAAGKAKAAECAGCHGEDGNGDPKSGFPRLAGQYQGYLTQVLTTYKTGERKHAIMNGIAGQLSADQIRDLSAYYASQKRGLIVIQDR